ncbi:MAG TPA: 30S ribosome-binding factor RbfA [Steroidobacteraceae bacterium]|nr:30S ribosome-binding factor RbfA [Steroidobacteraceae bacterium]
MAEARHKRIEVEIQRALAALVRSELKDPRVGNVTITQVSVAPDLKSARVFFVPFAASHAPAEVRAGLTHAAGFLRGEVGRRLGLRYAPRLEFRFDESLDRAQRLSELIEQAAPRERAGHADDSTH